VSSRSENAAVETAIFYKIEQMERTNRRFGAVLIAISLISFVSILFVLAAI
jgi:hypothetical protein